MKRKQKVHKNDSELDDSEEEKDSDQSTGKRRDQKEK